MGAADSQLVIPDAAREDPKSFEVARVWVAKKVEHVSLRVDVWKDPAAWGIILADLARHLANAYEQNAGLNSHDTLQRIKAGFEAEMDSPTDHPTGSLV